MKNRVRLAEKIRLRWMFLNNVQLGNLRQYAPRAVRHDRFPRSAAAGPLPRLAVVTPSFNQGKFLPATVASVLAGRGRTEVDYVVQDGGSTDGSAAFLESFGTGQNGFRWFQEKDAGQADAINKGFAKCRGEIMAWLNSDDLYAPGVLDFVAKYFRDHPGTDVVYGHRIIVDEDGREIGRWVLPPRAHEALEYFDYIPQETAFWRRELWEKVGGVRAEFQFSLDWDLLKRFRAEGARFVRLPYFLGCFRVHSEQKTSQNMGSTGKADKARLIGAEQSAPDFRARAGRAWFQQLSEARRTWLLMKCGIRR